MSETTERSYYLVEPMYFEKLLRTHFMLTQSTLLFEHLLSHSDRPMFLSARKVCEVLGMDRHQLEQCRKKRMIRLRSAPAAEYSAPKPASHFHSGYSPAVCQTKIHFEDENPKI